jgi:hypothetical protein
MAKHRATKTTRAFLLPALLLPTLLLGGAATATADSTPEAREWLDRMVEIYEQPFSVEFSGRLDLTPSGQPIEGELRGEILYADEHHSRTEMEMSLTGVPGVEGTGGGPTEMRITSVHDGTATWTEVDTGPTGVQVMKLTREDAEKLAEKQGAGGFGTANPASMDPKEQLQTMAETLDFQVAANEGGRVTLRGRIPEEKRAKLGQMGALGSDAFLLVLDAETGAPVEFRTEGETPMIRMEFHGLERLEPGGVPEGAFSYTPPEGVPVIDLGAVLQSSPGSR